MGVVRFSNTSVYMSMGSLQVEEGADLTLTQGSDLFSSSYHFNMAVEDSFLTVEDSRLKCEHRSLILVRSTTTFRNASVQAFGGPIAHEVVGGNVSYVNSFIDLLGGGFKLSLDSDSQVPFVNTTVSSVFPYSRGGYMPHKLIVIGEPSINVDNSSQIHCYSGQFPSRSGRNGSITVEGSVMRFESCPSSEQASVADTMLEGKNGAILI